jgi:hypothetical protein
LDVDSLCAQSRHILRQHFEGMQATRIFPHAVRWP